MPSEALPTSFFLPSDQYNSAVKLIVTAAIVISITHLILFHIINTLSSQSSKSSKTQLPSTSTSKTIKTINFNLSRQEAFKAAYQLTNLLVNASFGLYGIYACFIQPQPNPEVTHIAFQKISSLSSRGITDHVFGYDQYYTFASLQVGYNLWSLPMGLLYIKESPAMIMHHITVIATCSLAAVSEFGFRLHAPFFLGMFELSSVPLAIYNYMGDHHEWTMKNCKGLFVVMKASFAVVFLTVRIVLGTPHMVNVVRASFWATFTFGWHEHGSRFAQGMGGEVSAWIWMRMWVGAVGLAQCFLAMLQYWWAYMVILKVGRMIFPKKAKAKKVE